MQGARQAKTINHWGLAVIYQDVVPFPSSPATRRTHGPTACNAAQGARGTMKSRTVPTQCPLWSNSGLPDSNGLCRPKPENPSSKGEQRVERSQLAHLFRDFPRPRPYRGCPTLALLRGWAPITQARSREAGLPSGRASTCAYTLPARLALQSERLQMIPAAVSAQS
jgi:hypothetical protein